jgi:hypothetical protein
MNWLNKFRSANYKLAQIQKAQDALRVVTDIMTERGHSAYNQPDVASLANVDGYIREFLQPQIDAIANQIYEAMKRPFESSSSFIHDIELNNITLDDRNEISIRIYEPSRLYADNHGEAFHVYINLNERFGNNVRIETYSTIQEIKNQISPHVLTFTKEWLNASIANQAMKNALSEINDSLLTKDKGMEHMIENNRVPSRFVNELLEQYRTSVGILLHMGNVRQFHMTSNNNTDDTPKEEWVYDEYWTKADEELYQSLKHLTAIEWSYNTPTHLYVNDKTDLYSVLKPYAGEQARLDVIVLDSTQFLNLPYNILLYTINWIKDKVSAIEGWRSGKTTSIQNLRVDIRENNINPKSHWIDE